MELGRRGHEEGKREDESLPAVLLVKALIELRSFEKARQYQLRMYPGGI